MAPIASLSDHRKIWSWPCWLAEVQGHRSALLLGHTASPGLPCMTSLLNAVSVSPTQFREFTPQEMFEQCMVAKSKNGWLTTELFAEWLENVFIPQTKHIKKPLLLLVDGHVSHQSVTFLPGK
ncbi:transposase [Plakobranchus ocellatus]|uniref:Transposase n=1 Tax=Plakobranchus ocellatus TaxID=259542 RepID=A0AAV3ZR43_9GAST|nr:transposase [Plakobranchus ocellatus]